MILSLAIKHKWLECKIWGYSHCNDLNKGSLRDIYWDNIDFNYEFKIENTLLFDNAANVEVNFLLWVDTLPIEKFTKLPHDNNDLKIK